MKKNRLPISRHGAALTGGAFALIAAGLFSADGLLLLMGLCGLLFLILAWLLAYWSLRSLDVAVQMPQRVRAGKSFELELTLFNRRVWLDAFNTEVIVVFPDGTSFTAVSPWTAAGSASRVLENFVIPRRGYGDVLGIRLSSTFPLGLFQMKRALTIRQLLTVTPRPIHPIELSSDGSLHDSQPRGGVTTGQSFGEPRGIRPWQAGDSARRIHWPASARSLARGHDLRVREYDPPGFHPDHCHIVFHSYATGGEMLREDRFERAISLLAGSLMTLQGNGIPCVLTADFNDWQDVPCRTRAQLGECLYQLARVQRYRGSEAHDLEQCLRSVSSDHALMIISDMTPDSWSHLLVQHPHTLIVDIRQIRYRHKMLHAAIASV